MKKKFYTAKYDRVFKTIFCDEENPVLLQEFLSRILKKRIEIIEFLRNELPITTTVERIKTVDVLVKADGEYIHIEINGNAPSYLHTRNFIYFSTLYSKKTKRGEEYDLSTKFLHLDFTYHLKNQKDDYIRYYVQSNEGIKYLQNIEIIEFNMDKIIGYWYNKNDEKVSEYKHLIMLDLERGELEKLSKGDDFVEEYKRKVTDLNERETFQSAMTYEEDQKLILNTEKRISYQEGIEQGIEQGISSGSKEKQLEIARTMLREELPLETIIKCTGLTSKELSDLVTKEN